MIECRASAAPGSQLRPSARQHFPDSQSAAPAMQNRTQDAPSVAPATQKQPGTSGVATPATQTWTHPQELQQ